MTWGYGDSNNNNNKYRSLRNPILIVLCCFLVFENIVVLNNTGNRNKKDILSLVEKHERSIVLMHVGKTGGSSLSNALRAGCMWMNNRPKRRKCMNELQKSEETALSKAVKAKFHCGPRPGNLEWIEKATSIMFSVRDPVARFLSAWSMDHPDNGARNNKIKELIYKDCFPFPSNLSEALTDGQQLMLHWKDTTTLNGTNISWTEGSQKDTVPNCTKLAYDVVTGNIVQVYHAKKNYALYYNYSLSRFPSKEVFVVRTEHLWDDAERIDKLLGGNGDILLAGRREDHGSSQWKVHLTTSDFTNEELGSFCCALSHEYELYQHIVYSAVNLKESEKQDALKSGYNYCNIPTDERNINFSWESWRKKHSCYLPPPWN